VTVVGAVVAALAATIAVIVAVTLTGAPVEVSLYAYVLLLGAVGLLVLVRRTKEALPPARILGDRLGTQTPAEDRVPQLEALERSLASGSHNAFELHYRLRPIVREIVRARLARYHGIDLDRQPERARALAGARAWELTRPDREPPGDRFASGWPVKELQALVDELEQA
jgi:hypothetical protein